MAGIYDDRISHSENPLRFIKKRVSEVSPTWDSDDDSTSQTPLKLKPALLTSIVAGGLAGLIVDLTLYPLDTFKTRLQSPEGFRNCGGFKGVYKGIIPVLLSSAPISALFFATYNTLVNTLRSENSDLNPFVYMAAASAAEVVCASFRVPIEIIKQRKQVSNVKSLFIIKSTLRKEGIPGFYRGFLSTLLREIPFAAIQFPLWEYMINQLIIYENGKELTAFQTAYCGAAAGAIAAAITTPMDVVKTRIMLVEKEKLNRYKKHFNYHMAKEVYQDRGLSGFFAGTLPRVLWVMFGGFIYFGAYEKVKILCENNWEFFKSKIQNLEDQSPSYLEEVIEKCDFDKEGLCKIKKIEDDSVNEKEEKSETENENENESENNVEEQQKIIDATLL